MSFKVSLKDTSFHVSINSLGLYFSAECLCWIFSQTCIFYHVRENFQIYRVHIPRKCIKPRHFYSCRPLLPLSLSLLLIPTGTFFWKSVSPNTRKGWRKLWLALLEFNQKKWKWLETLGYSCFEWFAIFSNVMVLQFCK